MDTDIMQMTEDTAEASSSTESVDNENTQDDAVVDGEKTNEPNGSDRQTAAADTRISDKIRELDENAKRELFDQLLKDDPVMQQEFKRSASSAIKSRVSRLNHQHKQELSQYAGLHDALSNIYGVSDLSELIKKVSSDDSLIERQAYDAGMSVDAFKLQRELDRRERALNEREAQYVAQDEFNRKTAQWRSECEELEDIYPGINFEDEIMDEENGKKLFDMLQNGIPFKTAYEVVHINDLINSRSQSAAAEASKSTIDRIRAQGLRPSENANNAQAPSASTVDVEKMTAQQMDELIKRASRGEKISL